MTPALLLLDACLLDLMTPACLIMLLSRLVLEGVHCLRQRAVLWGRDVLPGRHIMQPLLQRLFVGSQLGAQRVLLQVSVIKRKE